MTNTLLRSRTRPKNRRPIATLIRRRTVQGLITLVVVSLLVFWATQLLPGNAANAVLGRSATPQTLAALQNQLGLDKPLPVQYLSWLLHLVTGRPGHSLVNGDPVTHVVADRLVNSAVLVVLAGAIGTVIGVALGLYAAARRDRLFDHLSSIVALTVSALPEFIVAVGLILLFATSVFKILPATSPIAPGTSPWSQPNLLVLPVATLVLVIVPYIFRLVRAVTSEHLESDYVQTARLKGLPERDVLIRHVLPNVVPAAVQAIGLSLLYLAGGVIVVEVVFDYPGIGQGLVSAVATRDIPVIQFLVMVLAVFYVVVNIGTDVITLIATPRRRYAHGRG